MGKYEFTGETKQAGVFGETTVRRIRAAADFGKIKAGDIGGWIEKKENLCTDGNAWVYGDAEVYEDAEVYGDAKVYGDAEVYGNAEVYGDAKVGGNAEVYGDAEVGGNAKVCGDAEVYGNAKVCGDAEVYGNAKVCGDAKVCGNAEVCRNAEVYSASHVLVVGPAGSRNAFTTFYRDMDGEITVKCGCFLGKTGLFLQKVEQTHGETKHALVYRLAAELAGARIGSPATAAGREGGRGE